MFAKIIKKVLIGAVILAVAFVSVKVIKKVFSRKSARSESFDEGSIEVRQAANGDYIKPRHQASVTRYKNEYLNEQGRFFHEQSEPDAVYGTDIRNAYDGLVEGKLQKQRRAAEGARLVTIEAEVVRENVSWAISHPAAKIKVVNGIPQNEPVHLKKTSPGFFEDRTGDPERDEVSDAVIRLMQERIFHQAGPMINQRLVHDLVQKAVRGFVPGTDEFQNAFGDQLEGVLPRGVLVPKFKPLMLPAQEEAEIRRWGWHKERPFEIYHFEGWREYHEATRTLYACGDLVEEMRVDFPRHFPRDWMEKVTDLMRILSEHVEGYEDDAVNDEAITLLTTIYGVRNAAWGLGGIVPLEKLTGLYKYAIYCFRKMLYTTPSLCEEYEETADAFEELLTLLSIPNPDMKRDYLLHTPMVRTENV